MPSWKKVITSGSVASLLSLNVTNGVTGSFTGSLIGTSSYSTNASSSLYAVTASYAMNGGGGGASFPYTGSAIITGSLVVTGSVTSTTGFTGSLLGTASYATLATTASYFSGSISTAISSSYASTASYISGQFFNTFSQSSAATTWSFSHNLSNRNPIITVWDNNNEVIIPERIVGTSTSVTTIYFPSPVAGFASATVGSILPQSSGSGGTTITGSGFFVPIFSGSNALTSSTIFQSGSYTAIRNSTAPENPLAPDILYVSGEGVNTYNLISAHGNLNGYVQVNVQNYSAGTSASSDVVATADNGTETSVYVDMGINSSTFINNGNGVGSANDAYMYSTGNDLFIGNASTGKTVTIFNGGLDTTTYARVFINDGGSVGINSNSITSGNPEALLVQSISSTTYNLISAQSNVDNYSQFNLKNASNGANASSDVVLTNNIGTETSGYVDLGINSSAYNVTGGVGGANDAYLYSKSNHLHIGNASTSSGDNLYFFTGGPNTDLTSRLVVTDAGLIGIKNMFPSYSLDVSGSTRISGSVIISGSVLATTGFTGSLFGTSSYATLASTASFIAGYVLTSATSSMTVLSASRAISASNADLLDNLDSTAFVLNSQTSSMTVNSASFAINASSSLRTVTASYADSASRAIIANTASFATGYVLTSATSSMSVLSANTASYATGYVLTSATSSMTVLSANTASYATGYVLTSATSSMTVASSTSASRAVSASNADLLDNLDSTAFVLNSQTSSMTVLSSSYATNASSSLYAVTASYAMNGGGGGTTITTQDEGSTLSSTVTTLNFVGAGVTAAGAGATTTITIPGGAGSSFPYTGSAIITGSLGITGSLSISQSLFQYNQNPTITSGSAVTIMLMPTSSYNAGFFDYVITSGSNARAGTVFSVWTSGSIEFTETSTNDIGNTDSLILSASISGTNVRLQGTVTTGSWNVKVLTRMI